MKYKLNNLFKNNNDSVSELESAMSKANEEPNELTRDAGGFKKCRCNYVDPVTGNVCNAKCTCSECGEDCICDDNGQCMCPIPGCVGICICSEDRLHNACLCEECECDCEQCCQECNCPCPPPECPNPEDLDDCVYEENAEIPFTAMVKVACGYVLTSDPDDPENPPASDLKFNFSLDEHCTRCVTECKTEAAYVCIQGQPKLQCDIPIEIGRLVGALHYNVKVNGFHVDTNESSSDDPTDFSQSESICIDETIGSKCKNCCPDSANNDCYLCDYKFGYDIDEIYVIAPGGEATAYNYSGTNHTAAMEILADRTGCKYIQFKGMITLKKGPQS